MSTSDLKRASASAVAWNLLQNLVGRLLGLAVMAILARLLDQSAFGAIAVALSVTTLAELVINQGYGEFVAQRPELTDEHCDTAFWVSATGGVTLTVLVAVAAEPIARALDEPDLVAVIRWLSPVLVIRSLTVVPAGLLVREMRFRSLSIRTVVAAIVGGAAGITAALAGLGIQSLVIQILAGEVVSLLTLWGATSWRPGVRIRRDALRGIVGFGVPIFLAGILNFVSRRLDATVIAGVIGLALLGVYSIAQRMFQIANQVINKSADAVAFSAMARLASEPERRRDAFYRVAELTAVLCFPLYTGLAVVAEDAIELVFGAKWLSSGPVLAVFALSGLPVSLSYLHSATLKAAGRTRSHLVIHVVLSLAYLPLLLVLVSRGVEAAAFAYLASCTVVVPLEIWFVRDALDLHTGTYVRRLVGPAAAALVMGLATYALSTVTSELSAAVALLLEVPFGAVVFALCLRTLARDTFVRSLSDVRDILRRKRGG